MNTQINEDYVSFEIAKLLKEKGFDELTCGFYYDNCTEKLIVSSPSNHNGSINSVSAPSQGHAMKWLREVHNIHIKVHCSGNRNYLVYAQSLVTAFQDICIESATCSFNSYEEACEAACLYVLNNLI